MSTRRAFVLGVLDLGCCGLAVAQGSGDAGAAGGDDGGLNRLGLVLEKQLSRRKGALPLPWNESILTPATGRLVWRPRGVSLRPGGDVFRVAYDPLTHWYFIAQVTEGGVKPRFFGPLEEARRGVFVEAFGPPPAPAASAPARKPHKPR